MKRAVFCVLVLIFLFQGLLAAAVFAQQPAPVEPTPTPDDSGNPHTFVTMDLPVIDSVEAFIGNVVGFSIVDDVIPLLIKIDELNITDMSPFNTWLENPSNSLQSSLLQKNSKPYTNPVRESARYCARLRVASPFAKKVPTEYYVTEPDTVQISAPIAWGPEYYMKGLFLDSSLGGYKEKAGPDGKIDRNRPVEIVSHISKEDCGKDDTPFELTPATLNVTDHAAFGEGSSIESSVIVELFDYVRDAFGRIISAGFKTIGVVFELSVTKKGGIDSSDLHCTHGYGCKEKDELGGDVLTNSRTPADGYSASFVPFALRRDPIGFGGEPNKIKVTILGARPNKDAMSFVNPEAGINRAYQSLKQADCSVTASHFIPTRKIGGVIPIADACAAPKEEAPQCEEADTYDEILKKLPGAIGAVCSKYSSNLPITADQCKGMMNEIFNIEIRNDPEWSGSNYRCEHRSDSTAAGPFQIIDETYGIVSCSNEQMEDDLTSCKTDDKQLSRCITEDAAELAMRVLLHYSDCNNVGTMGTTAELYEALCNYGTGVGVPLDHLDGKTYCEHIFDVVGLPKP